jgi:hypothetical protein
LMCAAQLVPRQTVRCQGNWLRLARNDCGTSRVISQSRVPIIVVELEW